MFLVFFFPLRACFCLPPEGTWSGLGMFFFSLPHWARHLPPHTSRCGGFVLWELAGRPWLRLVGDLPHC